MNVLNARRLASAIILISVVGRCERVTADWLQFRGALGASATPAELPLEFAGDENTHVAWRTPLPGRAVNGPIVVGDQVIATASSGNQQKRLHVFSVNDATGEIQWSRRFWATGRTLCHPLSAVASPTPASDGQHIFALFASNDLISLDLAGNVCWLRALGLDFPMAFDDRGLASSPCLAGDVLVVQIACSGDSFVLGLDAESGRSKWKIPLKKSTNWASPTSVELRGSLLVMLQSADRLLFVHPASGNIEYEYEAEGNLIPSPVLLGDTVLLPADGMTALRFSEKTPQPEVLWQEAKVAAETASPAARGDEFFVMRSPNILTAGSVANGSVKWKTRLSGNGFWATPLLSKSHLYVANTDGVVHVVEARDGEIIAKNELGEEVLGSPAAANNALYFRTTSHLWKIAS